MLLLVGLFWTFSVQGHAALADERRIIALATNYVIDGTSSPPIANGIVLIVGSRIAAVGQQRSIAVPEDAQRITLKNCTVLPGLVDGHTHITFYRADPADFDTDGYAALVGASLLHETLQAGITLVRDVGGRNLVPIALKIATTKGIVDGSRFLTSNQIVGVTGSHGSRFDLMRPPSIVLESDGPVEWRRNIRQTLKMGADFIMVAPPFTLEEIRLAVAEANRYGVMVGAEGAGFIVGPPAQKGTFEYPGTRTVEYAVRAGVDVVEHLYPMEDAAAVRQLMKKQGTIVVPTVSGSRRLAGERWSDSTESDERWQTTAEDLERQFREMHRAGVKLAIGTDLTGAHQGRAAEFYGNELELFVKWGVSTHETIQAATRIGAEAAGMADQLGTLEPGKLADLIIVPGNPLDDISILTQPSAVMRGGEIVGNLATEECGFSAIQMEELSR